MKRYSQYPNLSLLHICDWMVWWIRRGRPEWRQQVDHLRWRRQCSLPETRAPRMSSTSLVNKIHGHVNIDLIMIIKASNL